MCEEGWISEARQHLQCSVGLLMRAMLRMMELRGLTNFGKREQEEESGGGIWGLCYSLFDLGIKKKKKMAQRCRENERITARVPHSSFSSNSSSTGISNALPSQSCRYFSPPSCLQIITGSS